MSPNTAGPELATQGGDAVPALKPCPFCAGSARVVERDVEPQGDTWYGGKDAIFVQCNDCGCALFDCHFHEGFYNEREAIEAWNRRA